jgi:hypothetical protein
MRRLGLRTGHYKPKTHHLGMMKSRRIGRARAYDCHNNTTGELVIRNITADEAALTYAVSKTPEEIIDDVATKHFCDSDGFRISAHMAIGT